MSTKHYVHDRVVFMGGAEALCADLMHHFGVDEKTRLFTLYSSHEFFLVRGKKVPIVTALPQWVNSLFLWGMSTRWRIARWLFDYRNLMFFYPFLCWLLRKKIQQVTPDELIISSFAAVKNVVPPSGYTISTILYMHSPMQYIWENYDEYMTKLSGLKKLLFAFATKYLRPRDSKTRCYTKVYANSSYTADCIKKYYNLEAKVRYPQLPQQFFGMTSTVQTREYFVYLGRLVRFIREVDRIIVLCTTLNIPLLVIGDGPDKEYLQCIAGPSVTFVGHISNIDQKISVLQHARGLVNIAKESCGIATMEALALGVPVLGYAAGGTAELLLQDQSYTTQTPEFAITACGVLVHDKSPDVLLAGMQAFLTQVWDRKKIQHNFRHWFGAQLTKQ